MRIVRITACAVLAGALCAATWAQTVRGKLDIPAQPLRLALKDLGEQTGLQIVFRVEDVAEVPMSTPHISGELSPAEALDKLLSQSHLRYQFVNPTTVLVTRARAALPEKAPSADEAEAPADAPPAGHATGLSNQVRPGNEVETADSVRVEEVIVTATKREERLQDIPLSVAVITSQDVERRGLIGMEDYLRSVPGVNQIDNGPASNSIVVRGITTGPEFENFSASATVASYFGETPITGAAGQFGGGGIDIRPVDIERIEVLRGPQGTAYGDASLGGALRIIPAKPKLDRFATRLAASYSQTGNAGGDNSMGQVSVNIPLVSDKLAIRAVGYRYDESGFYRNIAGVDPAAVAKASDAGLEDYARDFAGKVQTDVGATRSTGGRLAALWQVTDKLALSTNFLKQKIEQDGRPVATVGEFTQSNLPVAPATRRHGEIGEFADSDIDLWNVDLQYDAGWARITSVASWIDSGSINSVDLSSLVPFPLSTNNTSSFRSFTAETRMASTFGGPFQVLGGVFYQEIKDRGLQTFDWPGAPAGSPFWDTNPQGVADFSRHLQQRALFGELSYDLSETWTAMAGGRLFRYEKKDSQLQEGGLFGAPIGAGAPARLTSEKSDSSLKASLRYKPLPNAMFYASWAEGFRLGRASAGLPSGLCDTNDDGLVDGTQVTIDSTRNVDSDFLENYEIGAKLSFLDRRVVLDAAAYHINWDGLPVLTTAVACNNNYVANAGAARSDGMELQARIVVARGLLVDVGGSYTNARLAEDSLAQSPPWHKGDRLPGAPKINANLAAQLDFEIFGRKAFVRADSMYAGKFFADLLETAGKEAGGYIKIDTRAGVVMNGISVDVFVRNLTNESAFTWRTSEAGVANPFSGYRLRPRTFGIQLGYTFE